MTVTKGPRSIIDPEEVSEDNPEGRVINIGTWMPIGNTSDVLDRLDVQPHELFDEYQRGDCDYFRGAMEQAEGLFRFTGWDILLTTWFEELPAFARRENVEDLPFTAVMAIPRDENGNSSMPEMLEWVMDQV